MLPFCLVMYLMRFHGNWIRNFKIIAGHLFVNKFCTITLKACFVSNNKLYSEKRANLHLLKRYAVLNGQLPINLTFTSKPVAEENVMHRHIEELIWTRNT